MRYIISMTYKKLEELEELKVQLEEAKNRVFQLSTNAATTSSNAVFSNGTNEADYSEYLDKNISPYIEDNIELIDTNNFTELYERADSWLTGDFENAKPYITDYLLACDINPLEYMKKVPSEYVNVWRETSIKIPDNIEVIEAESLNSHTLKHIILPKNLQKLSLHLNIYNDNNLYLHYPGTEADWRSIIVIEGSDGREYDIYVCCEEDGYKQKYPEPILDISNIYTHSSWKYDKSFLDKALDYSTVKWSEMKSNLKSYLDIDEED